jgi:hypothetical protein
VPLERAPEYAGREFLTDAEVAALDAKKAEDPGRNARAEEGSDRDVGGAYNAVFNSVLKTGKRTSMVVDPPDGKIPPLTPEAERQAAQGRGGQAGRGGPPAQAPGAQLGQGEGAAPGAPPVRGDGPEFTGARCLGTQMPALAQGIFSSANTTRIVQSPKSLAIYYEDNHQGGAVRVIPVDGSKHLPPRIRERLGDSRGRWDGNTLVVDTTNFSDQTNFRGSRGENLHMIERFSRLDATTLRREITFDDPKTWTKPWTVVMEYGRDDSTKNRIFESACHEGNFGIVGILAGARAQEKAAAAAAKTGSN